MEKKKINILLFELNGRKFAFEIKDVVQVVELVEITPLSGAPDKILGIINYHGEIIAVGDINHLLGLKYRSFKLDNKIIIVKINNKKFGFVVDKLIGYEAVDVSEHVIGEEIFPELKHVEGVIKLNDEIVLIKNVEEFLTNTEKKKLENAVSKRK